jgi:hypothetical protein
VPFNRVGLRLFISRDSQLSGTAKGTLSLPKDNESLLINFILRQAADCHQSSTRRAVRLLSIAPSLSQ